MSSAGQGNYVQNLSRVVKNAQKAEITKKIDQSSFVFICAVFDDAGIYTV